MNPATHIGKGRFPLVALIGAAASCVWTPAHGDSDYPHVVRKRETLVSIGKELLQEPRDWPRLQRHNRISNPRHLRPGTMLRIPLALMRREAVNAQVATIQGDVRANGTPLAVGDRIEQGRELTSGENSFATITLIDGSRLVLQPRSRLKLEEMTRTRDGAATHTHMRLEKGRVESDVSTSSPQHPRYRVTTPTATIGVRGTSFRVGIDDAEAGSRAEVTQGTVAASAGQSPDKPTAVAAGYGVVAQPGGQLSKPIALLPPPNVNGLARVQEQTIIRFAVPPLADADRYRFQIGAGASMSNVLAEALSTKPESKFADLPDGDYTMRVRGIDARGLEGRDADFAFRLKARPEPPFAISPVGGAKRRGESAPLVWAENTEATRYRIQIAADASFATPVADIDGVTGTTIMPANRLAAGNYYWRARSIRADGDAGPWGDAQHFALKPLPGDPDAASVGEKNIDFAWPGEPGQTFLFQIARDAGFADLVTERHLDRPMTAIPKPETGTYYMRVRATDPDGIVGPFTRAQQIEVPPAPPPWWLWLLPLLAFAI
jgi:hypothetical protein